MITHYHSSMLLRVSAFLFISFQAVYTQPAAEYPCDTTIRNGFTERGEGDIVYFKCNTNHAIINGPKSAQCINNVLDVDKLPSCQEFQSPKTRAHLTYEDVECSDENRNILKDSIPELFAEMKCLLSGECKIADIAHGCIHGTKIQLEVFFDYPSSDTQYEIKDYIDNKRYLSRRKRNTFPTPDQNNANTVCNPGQGLFDVGNGLFVCISCALGQYGENNECKLCAQGTYSDAEASTSCTACTPPATTLTEGSVAASDCVEVCTLAAVEKGTYQVNSVNKAAGDIVAKDTVFSLICDSGYYVGGGQSHVMTCGVTTNVLTSCYQVTREPSGSNVYYTAGGGTVTCKVTSATAPTSFILAKSDGNNDMTNWDRTTTSASSTASGTNDHSAEFTGVTAGTYTCIAVINGAEQYVPNTAFTTVELSVSADPSAAVTKYVGESATLTAQATYHSGVANTVITWQKDGNVYSTDISSSSDSSFFKSEASFATLALANRGAYTATASFKDQTNNEQASGNAAFTLNVVGLLTNPVDSFSGNLNIKYVVEATAQTIKCKAGYSSTSVGVKMQHKAPGASSFTDLTPTTGPTQTGTDNNEWEISYVIASAATANGGNYRCIIEENQVTKITGPEVEVSVVEGLNVEMNAETVCGVVGSAAVITCTAAYPDSQTNEPYMKFYKVNANGDDTLISDANGIVTSGSKDVANKKWVATLSFSSVPDSATGGDYYCEVNYPNDPLIVVNSLSATDATKQKTNLNIFYADPIAKQYKKVGEQFTLSAVFHGGNYQTATFRYAGNDLLATPSYNSQTKQTTVTLSVTAALDSIRSYDAYFQASASECPGTQPEVTTVAVVEIMNVNMTASNPDTTYGVDTGETLTLTCQFSNPSSLTSAGTVSWTKGTTAVSSGIDSTGVTLSPGISKLTIASTSSTDTGVYTCNVDYSSVSVTGVSGTYSVTVRGATDMQDNVVLTGAANTVFSCSFFGILTTSNVITWTKSSDSTPITSGVTPVALSGETIGSTLTITSPSTNDEYTCALVASESGQQKFTLQDTARIIMMQITSFTSSEATAAVGDAITLTCESSAVPQGISLEKTTKIKLGSVEKMSSTTANTYTISSALSTDNGVYTCEVQFGSDAANTDTETLNQYVRHVANTNAFALSDGSSSAVLTCVFYGDALSSGVTWTLASTAVTAGGRFSLNTDSHDTATLTTTATLTISSYITSDNGIYTCAGTYSTGGVTLSGEVTLSGVGLDSFSSTSPTVNKDGTFTLSCVYTHTDTAVVTWTKNGNAFTAMTKQSDGVYIFERTNTAVKEDNGVYECQVNYGTSVGSPKLSLTQYVREVELVPGATVYHSGTDTLSLTCKFWGDESTTATWKKDNTDVGTVFGVTAGSPVTWTSSSMFMETTVAIDPTVISSFGGVYQCGAVYTTGTESKTGSITVVALTASITGRAVETLGETLSLTCVTTTGYPDTITYSWTRTNGGATALGTERELSLTTTDAMTDTFTCTVTYNSQHTLTATHAVFIQSVVSLTQHGITTYNEVGETITLTGSIKANGAPTVQLQKDGAPVSSVSPSVTATSNANEYTFQITTVAAKPTTGNAVTYTVSFTVVGVDANAPSKDITVNVYDKCTLPSNPDITVLDGNSKDHLWSQTGLTCSGGKSLIFGTKVTCEDGTLVYKTASDVASVEPKCVEVSTLSSSNARASVGDDVSLTCQYTAQAVSSNTAITPSITPTIAWHKKDESSGTAVWNSVTATPVPGSGKSTLPLGSVTVDSNGEYKCTATYGSYTPIEKMVNQYVLYKDANSNMVVMSGETITFTCTFYGDITSAATLWQIGGSDKSSTSGYTRIDTNTAYMNKRVSTLAIASVNVAADVGTWSCTIVYTEGSTQASTTITTTEVAKPTVTGTLGLTKGTALALTCASTTDIQGVTKTYKWTNKATGVVLSQTTATYSVASVAYADALTYVCTITFGDKGSADADDAVVTVQGLEGFMQTKFAGTYNEKDEEIAVRVGAATTIQPEASQITFKVDGATQAVTPEIPTTTTQGQYLITIPFTATLPATGNDVALTVDITNAHGTMSASLTIQVYNFCTAPSVDHQADLNGQKMDHMEEKTNMACDTNYQIQGGQKAKCENGAITYSMSTTDNENEAPVCIGFETEPATTMLLQVGEEGKLICKTEATTLQVNKITWNRYDVSPTTAVYTDTTMTVIDAGASGKKYASVYGVDAEIGLNLARFKCEVEFMINSGAKTSIISTESKIRVAGISSIMVEGFSGSFIEIDTADASKSDSYTVVVKVYDEADPVIQSVTFKNAQNADLAFTSTTTTNGLKEYRYTPTEANKRTENITVTATYENFAGTPLSRSRMVFVYKFCKPSTLPSVTNGAWTPTTDVEHHALASLTCDANYYSVGTSTAVCGERADGEFYIPNTPSCQATNSLTCGELTVPANGYIIYKDSNTAYYYCNPGRVLIGDTSTTCNTGSGVWSHRNAKNVDGNPPICSAVSAATARKADVAMYFKLNTDYCRNADEKHNFEYSLFSYLSDSNILTCIHNSTCVEKKFACVSTNKVATVTFTLEQTHHMESASLLQNQVDGIISKNHTFTITTTPVKRSVVKRAAISAETDPSQPSTATIAATCSDANTFSHNGYCITCPQGSGKDSGTCKICGLGYYSAVDSNAACDTCPIGETTLNTGSKSATNCISSANLCTVKATPMHGHLFPTTGAKVVANTAIKLSCDQGYDLGYGVSTTFSCNDQAYPACYRTCDISSYNAGRLEELNIDSTGINAGVPLKHGQTLKVNCVSKYHFEKNVNSKVVTCKGDGTAEEAMIDFGMCAKSDSVTLIVIIILVVLLGIGVLLLFLFIFIQWRKKRNDHYKKKKRRGRNELELKQDDSGAGPSGNVYFNESARVDEV